MANITKHDFYEAGALGGYVYSLASAFDAGMTTGVRGIPAVVIGAIAASYCVGKKIEASPASTGFVAGVVLVGTLLSAIFTASIANDLAHEYPLASRNVRQEEVLTQGLQKSKSYQAPSAQEP